MKRWTLSVVMVGMLLAASSAEAQVLNPAMAGSVKAKKIYRGSLVIYENIFNARSLDKGAQQSYNPYYAQSLTLMPQIWLRDDMFVRARMTAEVELTLSDLTDTKREPTISDLFLDYMWLGAYRIPFLKIAISPLMRIRFPTSKFSQGMSMMFALTPGVMLSRGFKLHSGKFFSRLTLIYAFRFSARFHEYKRAQREGCSNPGSGDAPACQTSGQSNSKFRFTNSFVARFIAHPKVYLTFSVALLNDLSYALDPYRAQDGTMQPGQGSYHTGLVSSAIDITVPVARWLFLSVGMNSFHNQLEVDSSLQVPLFNRFVNFYFDVTVPIDKFVELFEA